MGSNIARIIDYTAVIAGGIEGVKSVCGSGQGFYEDPLRSGYKIEPCPSTNKSLFAHWSGAPAAPAVEWVSQSGTVELTWVIPMRLWLPKTDEEAIRAAMPFYDRYLAAFVANYRLDDGDQKLVLRSHIAHFRIGGSPEWSWLDVGLQVVERTSYGSA